MGLQARGSYSQGYRPALADDRTRRESGGGGSCWCVCAAKAAFDTAEGLYILFHDGIATAYDVAAV